jgi:hypothetical protein
MGTVTMIFPNRAALAPKHGADHAPDGGFALGRVMPWGIHPLIGLGDNAPTVANRTMALPVRRGSKLSCRVVVVSGCGYSAKGTAFLVTITAFASNAQSDSPLITVHLRQ